MQVSGHETRSPHHSFLYAQSVGSVFELVGAGIALGRRFMFVFHAQEEAATIKYL